MAYTFDATSGETRARLVERVTENSFSTTRYGEVALAVLNDAVLEVCQRLRIQRDSVVCAYVDGVVTQPTLPFFQVESVWTAQAGATTGNTGTREAMLYADRQLDPLGLSPGDVGPYAGGDPVWFTVRRSTDGGTSRHVPVRIELLPAPASGQVIVTGLRRPAIMDGDSDVTGLGADLDRAVIAYAKARLFELEDDDQMTAFWDNRFELALSGAPLLNAGPLVTPGTWGGRRVADAGR